MAQLEHGTAILVRRMSWSETSYILTWLTDSFGAVRTLAKGARRPGSAFAGKLDLLFQAEISFLRSSRSDLHTLKEVSVRTPFDARRSGSGSLFLAAYFAELAELAAPAMHPAPEVYDLLRRGVDHLQAHPPSARALDHFEKQLCRLLGVYDPAGKVSTVEALISLYGKIPASRAQAVRFLG